MMSFRDCTGQIQKFAVRFSASAAAEAFMNAVKDCLRCRNDIGHAGSDFVCENSAVSEFITSSGLHNSYDEESTYEAPIATVVPEFPALTFGNDETPSPPQPSLDSNVESIFSGFPPSFTDMLNSCTADHQKSEQTEKINVSSQSFPPEQSFDDAAQQSVFMEESRLKAQIAKYMSDASFHDMLSKIESVIVELGGDMAL